MTKEPCISIVGLGLMGASLAMALRKRGYAGRLVAFARKAETRREALARGIVDAAFDDPDPAVREATLVVLCAPIRACVELAADIAPVLRAGALVTDVGSTKGWICRQMAGLLPPGVFVGSHPIAGSEKQGLQAASADLYENALAVIASPPAVPTEAAARVAALWEAAGARTCRLAPEDHDRLLARPGRLPQRLLRHRVLRLHPRGLRVHRDVERYPHDQRRGRGRGIAGFQNRGRAGIR